jgi:glycosyltransferase involved in cell wall biosynthesis
MKKNILIAIVAYNAEKHIISVFKRIPQQIFDNNQYNTKVLLFDDASKDKTYEIAKNFDSKFIENFEFIKNAVNLGYGGNQKKAYKYAIENNFDIVVLLHGDGQYAPELLPEFIETLEVNSADCVLGSRMINKKDALNGGMPYYKFFGNIILTSLQNLLLGTNLKEFHTGYRAYSINSLKKIPFEKNSNDFEFDTDILIQLIDNKLKIIEIPIPTFYGDEVCNVKVLKYGWLVLKSTILSRLQKINLVTNEKFIYS